MFAFGFVGLTNNPRVAKHTPPIFLRITKSPIVATLLLNDGYTFTFPVRL